MQLFLDTVVFIKDYPICIVKIMFHILISKGDKRMNKQEKIKKQQDSPEKTAGNNQWTNNNLKYYPDKRKRQDGPGGN